MYVSPNYPSKAALKRALKPHSWYGQATVVDGVVTGVK